MKKVSIITVNFNQTQVTGALLESLKKQDYKNLEVIVVDNGSKEDCSKVLRPLYSWVKFIRSDKNLGFAGGNNLGIREALGDYLFFINNDTEVPEGSIQHLVDHLEQDPEIGIICPLIYYYDQPELLQFGGYTPLNILTGRNHAIGYKQPVQRNEQLLDTAFPHGAAMMVPKRVITQCGEIPENYFLYYEELDWGSRIRKAGYQLKVAYNAFILHKESISTGKSSPLKTYFQTRNRILYQRNHQPVWALFLFSCYFLLIAFPKNTLQYIIKNKWDHLRSFWAGVFWHLKNMPNSKIIGFKYEYLRD
jgi:hypothetical protein